MCIHVLQRVRWIHCRAIYVYGICLRYINVCGRAFTKVEMFTSNFTPFVNQDQLHPKFITSLASKLNEDLVNHSELPRALLIKWSWQNAGRLDSVWAPIKTTTLLNKVGLYLLKLHDVREGIVLYAPCFLWHEVSSANAKKARNSSLLTRLDIHTETYP